MIIKTKKLLFYGLKDEISLFFEKAQQRGIVEFIGKHQLKQSDLPTSLKNFVSAIKILRKQPVEKIEEEVAYSPEEICDRVIQTDRNIEHLEELKNGLLEEAKRVAPFGDFSLDEVEYIKNESNRIFQFFTIKTKRRGDRIFEDLIYISTDYDQDNFIAINNEKKSYPGYLEVIIDKPIGLINKRLWMIDEQLQHQRDSLKKFAAYLPNLMEGILKKYNNFNLQMVESNAEFPLDETIFTISGWLPCNKEQELEGLLKEFSIVYEVVKIEETDQERTYLENNRIGALGEDLIKIYDIPSTSDTDPSNWVLWAFALFYAMIVSDAGYGLIYLLSAFFMKYKIKNPKPNIKRFNSLLFILSISIIVWGVMTASFFGIEFKPESMINKVSPLNYAARLKADYHLKEKDDVYKEWVVNYPEISKAKSGEEFLLLAKKTEDGNTTYPAIIDFERNILLEFSILVGMVHISIASLINLRRHWAGLGWVIFILGGYLYFPSVLQATSMVNFFHLLTKPLAYAIGLYVLYFGMASAFVLSLIQNKLSGLREITNVVGIFGDILSYLRLYALGLSGLILSDTFDIMASSMNIFFGFFLIVIGHSINLVLGIMGGVIHGLRLNFLEWYNHCFEGGGKLFKPLKLVKYKGDL